MEHREDERQNVAGRYMAGELTTVEREDFERHYFECVKCAVGVRAMVQAGFTVAVASDGAATAKAGWLDALWSWRPRAAFVLATACVALVFTSYEALRARGRLGPQPVTAYHLLPDDVRGAERAIGNRSGEFVVLTADLPEAAPEWKWQIRTADSSGLVLEGVAAVPPGGTLSLLMPVSRLTPGRFTLSLRDTSMAVPEITYSFRIL